MESASEWKDTLLESFKTMGQEIAKFLPNLLGMLLILAVGYLVSKLAFRLARLLLAKIGFDRAAEKMGLSSGLEKAGMTVAPSQVVAKLLFWFVMLTFLMSAAETAGLEDVSQTISTFVAYVPSILGALVVLMVGLVFSGFARDMVRNACKGLGLDYGDAVGNLVYGLLLVIIASLAIGQLKVETELINDIVTIFLAGTAAALALALGLGSRDLAKQVMAGVYARDLYRPGDEMSVGQDRGRLLEVGAVSTVLECDDGERVHLPNASLTESVVRSRAGEEASDEGGS